eukprot:scaffold189608_cov28-Tisochrysis_lutea.AAC.1
MASLISLNSEARMTSMPTHRDSSTCACVPTLSRSHMPVFGCLSTCNQVRRDAAMAGHLAARCKASPGLLVLEEEAGWLRVWNNEAETRVRSMEAKAGAILWLPGHVCRTSHSSKSVCCSTAQATPPQREYTIAPDTPCFPFARDLGADCTACPVQVCLERATRPSSVAYAVSISICKLRKDLQTCCHQIRAGLVKLLPCFSHALLQMMRLGYLPDSLHQQVNARHCNFWNFVLEARQ